MYIFVNSLDAIQRFVMICVTLKHERNNFHSRRKDDLQWRVHFFVTFQWLVNRLEYCHKDRGCVCRGLALLCNCSFNDLSFTMYLFKINVRIVCVFILDYTCAFDEYYLEWMSVFNGCCLELRYTCCLEWVLVCNLNGVV